MKILVTGASGPLATATINQLLQHVSASDLILMSRKPEKLAPFAKMGCKTTYGDFKDRASLDAAVQGADKMLMISGYEVGHRVAQHSNAIFAARDAGVGHIVYTSFIQAVPENKALITQDHSGTEAVLRECGVAWTAMRDANYCETITDAAGPAAIKNRRWIASAGEGKAGWVPRADCVSCLVSVLTTPGHKNRSYNIGATETWSFPEIAALMTEITGVPIEYVNVTDDELYAYWDAKGVPRDALKEFNYEGYAWCSDDMVSYEKALREGWWDITTDDVKTLIGRDPQSLRDFCYDRADQLRAAARA